MAEAGGPRRPPPLPNHLPRRTTPPAPTPTGPPGAGAPPRARTPLPEPRLMRERPPGPEAFGNLLEPPPESLLTSPMAWIALIGWTFVLIVLLLVVVPTDAIPNLVGPFRQPVSAAAYGPLVAIFAVLAVLVTVSGLFWMWLAMSRDREPGHDDEGGP
ncbi:MAG TPA: DUF3736 domain-containing protein [Chloroflexota bacterium]|jgi:hypothetical protein